MRERGSALLLAIVSVMVLLLISGVLFSLFTDQMKSNAYEERAIRSYYLAQAGVFYGVAKLKDGFVPELFDTPDGKRVSEQEPHDDPFGYGGQFTVQWEEFESGYKIYGRGLYGEDTRQVERTLLVYYKTGSSGGAPGGVPDGIIEQELLFAEDEGHAKTMFYFSNDDPNDFDSNHKVELNSRINLNEPLYIFIIMTSSRKYSERRYASNVKLNLKDANGNIVKHYFDNEIFIGVYDNHNPGSGAATPIMLNYNGSETVRLEVEGIIDNNNNKYDTTGTVTNWFNLSSDDGLIWQIEN